MANRGGEEWLPTAEAARRLGVKRETLYSYVSRGMLSSRPSPTGRGSLFDRAEVASLASRARSGGRAGALEVVVDSRLTLLDPRGRLWFRGWDVEEACRRAGFEQVAAWLWSEDDDPAELLSRPSQACSAPESQLSLARAAASALPPGATPIERLRLGVAAAASDDPLRFDRRREGVAGSGRRILACAVAALGSGVDPASGIARSLWTGLASRDQATGASGTPPGEVVAAVDAAPVVAALDAALVLLADHELSSSTLAARVAASTWADPYLVVLAGLAALGGPLHGGMGDRVASLVRAAAERGAATAVGEQMRQDEAVVGFGHMVYTERDPRGTALLEVVRAAWPGHPAVKAGDEIIRIVAAGGRTFPNVDFGLGVLLAAGGFSEGSAEVVFATARIAGWLAHAIEEYGHRLRYRARAAYTGLRPAGA